MNFTFNVINQQDIETCYNDKLSIMVQLRIPPGSLQRDFDGCCSMTWVSTTYVQVLILIC